MLKIFIFMIYGEAAAAPAYNSELWPILDQDPHIKKILLFYHQILLQSLAVNIQNTWMLIVYQETISS